MDHFLYFYARHWVEFKQVIVSIWHVDVGRAVAVIQPVRHDKKFSRQVSLAETKKKVKFVRQGVLVFCVLRTMSGLVFHMEPLLSLLAITC